MEKIGTDSKLDLVPFNGPQSHILSGNTFERPALIFSIQYHFRVIHELMHAMGFWHEHTRPDRGKYIEVIEENIVERWAFNLHIQNINQANLVGKYDLCSIMHYYVDAYAKYKDPSDRKKGKLITMKPKRKECSECYGEDCKNCYNCGKKIGLMRKNQDMTDMDIEKINVYYNCKEIGTFFT